ncbi:MAG: thiamine-phosphate kinase [Planctomycetaceae bacterium]|nr:thiamine-phosphate kinase [Planctomycetaceae bacterium]
MEAEFVAWLRQRLATHPTTPLGLSDDAALLPVGGQCVITSDLLCDGVHFEIQRTDFRRIGHKALAVNLSDLAAMAATPQAAFVSLLLPHEITLKMTQEIYEGILSLAERYKLAIAGGDTNRWQGALAISITATGLPMAAGALTRSQAQVGDAILVTGQLGGSRLGHHLDFEPRVREASLLHQDYQLHAGMDISDGLTLDLSRLCEASQVGAELVLDQIPISASAAQLSLQTGNSSLNHALADGEDFELLFTMAPNQANKVEEDQPLAIPVTRIGTVIAEAGLWHRDNLGVRQPLQPKGYLH